MKKICSEKACKAILAAIMIIAIIFGIVFFLSSFGITNPDFDRLVIYSILIIFGIAMIADTYLYRRLKEEGVKLKKELEKVKKELVKIKK
jgi:hypothetical protein